MLPTFITSCDKCCERVELFLNDKSKGIHETADFTNNTIVWNLPYTPGKIEAKGYNGEQVVTTYTLTTSGQTSKAVLKADRPEMKADRQDLSFISIQLEDENGNPVQTDDKELTVSDEGEGRLMGIDNGDLRRRNSFAGNVLRTYFGKALVVVQSSRSTGKIQVSVTVDGIDISYLIEITSKKD
jgi:beta-galactosidase